MTTIRLERHGYTPTNVRPGLSETPEQCAKRLRSLYPDTRAVALVVSSPFGSRVERFL